MFLYLLIILTSTGIICTLNIAFLFEPFNNYAIWVIIVTIFAVILEIAIDSIIAFVIHCLPNKFFKVDNKFYCVGSKEKKFYDKLHIKNWKDKICELGGLGGFSKSKINNPTSEEYLERFIIESNKGVLIHIVIIFVGFLIMLFPVPKYFLRIGLPVAIVNAFLNVLPIMVLRYNTPKLKIAYERAKKMKEIKIKEEEKENEDK